MASPSSSRSLFDRIRAWKTRRRIRREWQAALRQRRLLDRLVWEPLQKAPRSNAPNGGTRTGGHTLAEWPRSVVNRIRFLIRRWWRSPGPVLWRRRLVIRLLCLGMPAFLNLCFGPSSPKLKSSTLRR